MPYDRDQLHATLKAKAAERQSAAIPALQVVRAAGMIAAHVQTTDEWNRFLSYVQGFRDKAQGAADAARVKQNDPAVWESAELAKLKSQVIEADAQIRAFDLVIGLPKFLTEAGRDAAVDIEKYERANEAPAATPS